MSSTHPNSLAAARTRLNTLQGKAYWRSLEELANTDEFQNLLQREFPHLASVWGGPLSRRQFLKLMAASLALAGLSACVSVPREKIVPYVRRPAAITPGEPLFFATALSLAGYAEGLLVESREGRPIKVEGNPDHPASLGATGAFAQASVLTLYDPERSQTVTHQGQIQTWESFLEALSQALEVQRANQGAGLRVLTETVNSPTLAQQLQTLLTQLPRAKWHQYEPAGRDNVRAGARLAFGQIVETRYAVDKADVILSLDSDFLSCGPGHLSYVRDFAARRRMSPDQAQNMNRLYVVEALYSPTGAKADHRLPLRATEMEAFTRALAARLGVEAGPGAELPSAIPSQWFEALLRDLTTHRGSSLIVVGDEQPPVVHALTQAMNAALGNVGQTLIYTDPVEFNPLDQMASLRELVQDMEAGAVELLVILGGNPVYSAPADLNFGEGLKQVKQSIHLSLYEDETSVLCNWHIPESHYLEAWSDARAFDGTISLVQPLITPLYASHSAHEVLAALTGQSLASAYDLVRGYWQNQFETLATGVSDFDSFWQAALDAGVMTNTALPAQTVTLQTGWAGQAAPTASPSNFEIIFRPDPTIYDGRFANNAWLQELPKPITKLTWDNAALMAPSTAQRLGLVNEDVVELRLNGQSLLAPVWIMPGHAPDSVTVHLGYGRTHAGRIGNGLGFNAYTLRTASAPWFAAGLEISKTGKTYPLATTQPHHLIEGRNLLRAGTVAEYQANPNFVEDMEERADPAFKDDSLYPPSTYTGNRWGMAIDLSACVGCNACVVACQAENNIPTVGKEQVRKGREMHWLRVDSYFEGEPDNPQGYFQPVPCMQCEEAPCEVVCPVGATTHSEDGLNDMVYNRCVGTRYCSNNCPYKVRRFNFLQYANYDADPSLSLLPNPEVTVRTRGVMEKCTYCVQRIRSAQVRAEKESRAVRDGEVVTACQAVCPAQAIVFGDMNDAASQVTARKSEPRNYAMLAELNTRPRTTYLAALRNPNPEIETS